MVYVNMSGQFRIALGVNLYYSVEKFMDSCAVTADGRAYRHT